MLHQGNGTCYFEGLHIGQTKSQGPVKPQGDQGNAILSCAWRGRRREISLLTLTAPLINLLEVGSSSSLP